MRQNSSTRGCRRRPASDALLERLTRLIDWDPREALVTDLHALRQFGRPSYPPLLMVKVHAAPAVVPGVGPRDGRGVVGAPVVSGASWDWGCWSAAAGPLPTAMRWWPRRCAARGEAAQARAAPGTRTRPGPAGAKARFGYKLHLGVDADSELVRRAVLTPANVNETTVADGLIAGDEGAVYGDAAYGTHARSARLRALGIADRLMRRPTKHQPRLGPTARRRHARIEQVRRPVEHVFGTLKRSYGYQRVRHRGLARNTTEMWFKLLAYNLRRADRLLAGAPAPS